MAGKGTIKHVNERPISLSEGTVSIDGKLCFDACEIQIHGNMGLWKGKSIGSPYESAKTTGVTYRVVVKHRKQTPWARQALQKYLKDGITAEFQIQGVQKDKDSDFFDNNGAETVTANGCVIDGDIKLLELKSEGGVFEDTINFHAHDINFS